MYSLLVLGNNVRGNWSTGQGNGRSGSVKEVDFPTRLLPSFIPIFLTNKLIQAKQFSFE